MMKPIISLCLASGLLAAVAHAGQVSGKVKVTGQRNRSPVVTVVYAESLTGPTPVRPGHFTLEQQNKAFLPRILAIPAGSKVDAGAVTWGNGNGGTVGAVTSGNSLVGG